MASKKKPRIPPVPPAKWGEAEREVMGVIEGEEAYTNGSKFNVILTMANHPRLAIPFLKHYDSLLKGCTIPLRLLEIITLRVALRRKSEYEWVQHVRFGKAAGLTDAHIEAIKEGPANAIWTEVERTLLQAEDEIAKRSKVSDRTWKVLKQHFTNQELMELHFIIGTYTMLCWAFNSFGVQLEEGMSA